MRRLPSSFGGSGRPSPGGREVLPGPSLPAGPGLPEALATKGEDYYYYYYYYYHDYYYYYYYYRYYQGRAREPRGGWGVILKGRTGLRRRVHEGVRRRGACLGRCQVGSGGQGIVSTTHSMLDYERLLRVWHCSIQYFTVLRY